MSRALEGTVPSGLAVAQVLVPELPAGEVSVEWKLPPRVGWVPVMTIVRRRGREVGRAWARVELRPPPGPPLVARGTPVRVIVRRGAVTVSAYGNLERAARVTDRTSARLNELGRVVSGRLVDGSTLIADEGTP